MSTSRRSFLQWTLGACAFTAAQKAGVVRALDELPPEPEPKPEPVAELHYADPGPGLYLCEPVNYRWQLPRRGSCEGETRWVRQEYIMMVWVDDIGWVQLTAPTLFTAGAGLDAENKD